MFAGMGAVIFWFKRDLRVSDSPALAYAASLGLPVLPVYVAEPDYWALPDTSARQWDFVAECLQDLRGHLPLVVRVGDAVEVLAELARAHDAHVLVSHEETGNLWTYARDRRVAGWARGAGVAWHELPQCAVERRMHSRDGWAARRGAFVVSPQVDVPQFEALSLEDLGRIPAAPELGLAPDICPQRQAGGRAQGLSLLGGFLTQRGQSYRKDMSSPVAGEWGCSRLSPYLAYGALTVREVSQATAARQREVKGSRTGWTGSLRSFQSRLAWRDHFTQKLEDQPSLEIRCMHSAYEALRPREADATRLAAWETGETGLPFVDACMRYLKATGWLNFRMRSMLMAVASYHLWLDWRHTGPHLARMFTDYEPGIHWPQVQMQSGTTGINTVRIYNPVKQGHDQDPTGVFTRRWLPELAEVPDRHLQEPWLWEGAGRVLGHSYPAPIVDVKRAAKRASEQVWALRKGADFRAEAQGIVTRHASRKEGGGVGRMVRDRNWTAKGDGQLELDL
jgi:deoxyribodipyrimidine photo-lyase